MGWQRRLDRIVEDVAARPEQGFDLAIRYLAPGLGPDILKPLAEELVTLR